MDTKLIASLTRDLEEAQQELHVDEQHFATTSDGGDRRARKEFFGRVKLDRDYIEYLKQAIIEASK